MNEINIDYNFLINYFSNLSEESVLEQFENLNLNLNNLTKIINIIPSHIRGNIAFTNLLTNLGTFITTTINSRNSPLILEDYINYFMVNSATSIPEVILHLLNSDLITINPFKYSIEKYKKNLLILLTFNNNQDLLKKILDSKYVLDEIDLLLNFKDSSYKYTFCNYLFYNNLYDLIKYLYDKKVINDELILKKNNNNDTNLILSIRFGPKYLDFILSLDFKDLDKKEFLNSINNDNVSCLHQACRYSLESSLILLEHDLIDLDKLKKVGNIIFQSCYYINDNILDILLNDFKFNDLLLCKYINKEDINVLFASAKSSHIFKYILKFLPKEEINKLIKEVNFRGDNILIHASKYCLESLMILLNDYTELMFSFRNEINYDNKIFFYYLLNENYYYKLLNNIFDLLIKNKFIDKDMLKRNYLNDIPMIFKCSKLSYLFNKLLEDEIIDEEIFSLRIPSENKSLLSYLTDYFNIKNIFNSNLVINLVKNNIITSNDLNDFIKIFSINNFDKLSSIILCDIFSLGIVDIKEVINIKENNETIIDHFIKNNCIGGLKFFLDNKFISKETFKVRNDFLLKDSNYLSKSIINGSYKMVELIGNSNLMTKDLFDWENSEKENIIYIASIYYYEDILDYILNHKFFSYELIAKKNNYDQNLIMRLISNNCAYLILVKILEKCKEYEEILNMRDSSDWNLLMYCCNHISYYELINYFILNNLIKDSDLLNLSKSNNNFLLLLLKKKDNMILSLLKKMDITDIIINNYNEENENIFTYIENMDLELVKYFFSFNVEYKLLTQVYKNICPIVKLGNSKYEVLDFILNDKNFTKEIIESTNNDNENILFYCLKKENLENFNRIYYSIFCTKKLLLTKDKLFNRSCLYYFHDNLIDVSVLKDILEKCDGKKIINELDYNEYSLFLTYILDSNTEYIKLILDMDLVNEDVFDYFYEGYFHFAKYPVVLSNDDILKMIVKHKYFKEEFLLKKNHDNTIILFENIDNESFKYILNEFDNIGSLILKISDDNNTYLFDNLFETMPFDNFIVFINSKHFTKELLQKKTNYGHNLVRFLIYGSLKKLEEILKLDIIDEDIFNGFDYDNDSIISCFDNDVSILKCILNCKFFNNSLFTTKNNIGRTPLFNFMNLDIDIINYLIDNNYINKEMLKIQDINGNTCLHIYEKTNELVIKKIIDSDLFDNSFLEIVNNKNQNIFMFFCKYNMNLVEYFYNSKFFNKELLLLRDFNGNNILHYLFQNKNKNQVLVFLNVLKSSKYFSIDLVLNRNIHNDSIFFECEDEKYLDFLLLIEGYDYKLLTKINYDESCCLFNYIKKNKNLFKKIIKWNRFNKSLFFYEDTSNKQDIFHQICIYNPSLIEYIVKIDINIEKFIFGINNKSIINLINNSPSSFKVLINSKYSSVKLINYLFRHSNILLHCWSCQPCCILDILNHKHFNRNFFYIYINDLLIEINKHFFNINIDNIHTIPMINKVNIPCSEDDLDCCNICYGFKSSILFNNCFHKTCVSCSLKLEKCHICRTAVTKRHFIY